MQSEAWQNLGAMSEACFLTALLTSSSRLKSTVGPCYRKCILVQHLKSENRVYEFKQDVYIFDPQFFLMRVGNNKYPSCVYIQHPKPTWGG